MYQGGHTQSTTHHLNTLSTLLNSTNASAAKSSSCERPGNELHPSPTTVAGEDASSPRIVAGEEDVWSPRKVAGEEDAWSPRIVAGESVPGGSFFSVESLVMVWEKSELASGAGSLRVWGFVLFDILGGGVVGEKGGSGEGWTVSDEGCKKEERGWNRSGEECMRCFL